MPPTAQNTYSSLPLGKNTPYINHYAPELLVPLSRQQARDQLSLTDNGRLPFVGNDYWTAYELSWLNKKGKPVVATAEFTMDCRSPYLIESKSFKLYLNSFNQTPFADTEAVKTCLRNDLSTVLQSELNVVLFAADSKIPGVEKVLPGRCIDHLELNVQHYQPDARLLQVQPQQQVVRELLYSHLLKTNCPVTGQPDWATVFVEYSGRRIIPDSLLAYIISFREHRDFHEHCVERMFCDIQRHCEPDHLVVYARYTRRGGLDINPLRKSPGETGSRLEHCQLRTFRQ